MLSRRNLLRLSVSMAVACACSTAFAGSETYPDRPVSIIITKPPGGLDDSVARVLAPELQKVLGQSVIVENIGGASGIIGTQNVIRSDPDGYRLLFLNTRQQITAGVLQEQPPYDLSKDVVPIISFAGYRTAVIAHESVPGKDLNEVLQYAKDNPKTVVYGSTGPGSTAHLVGAMAAKQAGAEMIHVTYNGGGPGSLAIVAGEAHLFYTDMNTALNALRAGEGKVRIVAQSGTERAPEAPDAPLFSETGFDIFANPGSLALVGPVGLDPAIVDKIHASVSKAIEESDVAERLSKSGVHIQIGDGAALSAEIDDAINNWAAQAKAIMAEYVESK